MINRPRPLSDLLPNLTKDIFGRKNLLFGKMAAEWAQIAGAEIAGKATPLDLKFSRKADTKNSQAVLHLAVQPAYALEFSYQKSLLIERLNIFFGYPAIKDIKIIQHSEVMNNKPPSSPKIRPVTLQEERHIEGLIANIQENDLQTALKNLGKSMASRAQNKYEKESEAK
jgi:hypothetical protein